MIKFNIKFIKFNKTTKLKKISNFLLKMLNLIYNYYY